MSHFFKKHYKKFLIFCSLFILGFTILFAKPNKVNANSLTVGDYNLLYINGPCSYSFTQDGLNFNLDLPKNLVFNIFSGIGNYSTDFYLSATIYDDIIGTSEIVNFNDAYLNGDPINTLSSYKSGSHNTSGVFTTISPYIYYGGTEYFFNFDSFLYYPQYIPTTTYPEDTNFYFVFPINTDFNSDTIFYNVSFNYYYKGASSNGETLLSDFYSFDSSISYLDINNNNGLFNPLSDVYTSVLQPLDLPLYYLSDLTISFTTDSALTSYSSISYFSLLSNEPFNFDSFLTANNFNFGLSQSEIDTIYNDGYSAGVESVDTQSYYDQGYTHASEDFLKFENLVFSVMNGFTNTIESLLDFEIFGISVFGLIGGLVACAFGIGITILIIKAIKIFT